MTKPISPSEINEAQASRIPDFIIDAVNQMLAKNYRNGRAMIFQDELLAVVLDQSEYDKRTIFDNNWFDFEPAFIAVGWNVKYDKPGFNESYRAFWEFKK